MFMSYWIIIYIHIYVPNYVSVCATLLKLGTTSQTDMIQDIWCFLKNVLCKSQRLSQVGLILIYYFMTFFLYTFLLGDQRQHQLMPTEMCVFVSQSLLENGGRLNSTIKLPVTESLALGVFLAGPYKLDFACWFFFQSEP